MQQSPPVDEGSFCSAGGVAPATTYISADPTTSSAGAAAGGLAARSFNGGVPTPTSAYSLSMSRRSREGFAAAAGGRGGGGASLRSYSAMNAQQGGAIGGEGLVVGAGQYAQRPSTHHQQQHEHEESGGSSSYNNSTTTKAKSIYQQYSNYSYYAFARLASIVFRVPILFTLVVGIFVLFQIGALRWGERKRVIAERPETEEEASARKLKEIEAYYRALAQLNRGAIPAATVARPPGDSSNSKRTDGSPIFPHHERIPPPPPHLQQQQNEPRRQKLNSPDALVYFPPDHPAPPPYRERISDPLGGILASMDSAEVTSGKRAQMIKDEMRSAWGSYKRHAWGHDELRPVSKGWNDWGGRNSKGTALTIIDSLSTLWLMGLKDEFNEGVKYVTDEVDFDQDIYVSVFESTIRIIGGLLSAYELSGEKNPKLLATVRRVMDKLLVAYNTSSGLPHQSCNLRDGRHWGPAVQPDTAILSEFGSVQLELRTLSYHTKDPKYDIRATHITDICESQCKLSKGLCPTIFAVDSAARVNVEYTLGGNSDSYYEYLLKQYLLTGKTEPRYKRLTLEALDEAVAKLLKFSQQSKLAYFDKADFLQSPSGRSNMKMDHLTCFAGGMYALAADTFPEHKHAAAYRVVAERITKTCNVMYEREPSGLGPDSAFFVGEDDFIIDGRYHMQRPEAIESMFYQWRYTRDPKYREWAWKIYLSIRKYSKTSDGGFSGASLSGEMPPAHDDLMQSFFMAETLKYLFLIFSDDSALDLDEWVLNTEAHPLRMRKRDPLDIWRQWEGSHEGIPAFMPPTLPGVVSNFVRTETESMKGFRGDRIIVAEKDPLSLTAVPADVDLDSAKQQIL